MRRTLTAHRFDGRTIRVDKASDNGPRGGFGGGRGGFGGGRGGFGGPVPYGGPMPGYQMPPPNMYAPVAYGRGYPPQGYVPGPAGRSPGPFLGLSANNSQIKVMEELSMGMLIPTSSLLSLLSSPLNRAVEASNDVQTGISKTRYLI